MANTPAITDIEIAKLLLDPKRNQILSLANNEPITVKQMAEKMNELPSRLYYHVKKLEEVGFIELVETKQQGNLIEKYYLTNPRMNRNYQFDDKMLSENSTFMMQRITSLINSGLNVIQHSLQTESDEYEADVSIAFKALTSTKWKLSHDQMLEALKPQQKLPNDSDSEKPSVIGTEENGSDAEEKDSYVFVILSYRQKDAERLSSGQKNE
ncbi:ArsR family transcriptional regulator [Paenibacillus albiflavus]|uniref:ArsR family transcriptional regulator n=1 Tax=Paenibacillus albiflavus TaxID=2545760 RepID=A0A4R4E9P4_9BACL|nr:helix-turn-helix domain-containing protein [Paenibacillus albiflavus]TCZ76574.1 ArsR family transcriptional regulator [Paenibacillus albiflavus]